MRNNLQRRQVSAFLGKPPSGVKQFNEIEGRKNAT